VDSILGDYQNGYDQMQAGLKLWRELGDPHSISLGLNFLVETQVALGRHDEAIASMRESIALCERTKNRWGMGTAYRYLGLATLAAGQPNEARAHLEKSLEIFGDAFKGWDIAQTMIYLGETHLRTGDDARAKTILLDSLRLARDIRSEPLILQALAGLASLEIRVNPAIAAGWLTLILSHPSALHITKVRAEELLSSLPVQGDSNPTIEQAVEEALRK